MGKKLFLLDGMALIYRAHFALISRPIFTSKGFNTSALYGFTQTVLDILGRQEPTHLAVALDTEAPTARHREFAAYKATRQEMPEDLSQALPHLRRLLEAFRIPILAVDGYEADDLIGTLVRRAEAEGFLSYMVTPDKDFGQLVTERTLIYKPGRMGEEAEILGVPEICRRWGIKHPSQVVDVLALMGDSSDNIPGVPGIGEKTAIKLIAQYGSVEETLAHAGELTGRLRENLEKHRDLALLSKRLVTILCDVPCDIKLDQLARQAPDEDKLKEFLVEFEFNSIGRRLFGEEFKAGRGYQAAAAPAATPPPAAGSAGPVVAAQGELVLEAEAPAAPAAKGARGAELATLAATPHQYEWLTTAADRRRWVARLGASAGFALRVLASEANPRDARLLGLAFSLEPHTGACVLMPEEPHQAQAVLEEFRPVLESGAIGKTGHDLKFDLGVLRWQGVIVRGPLFDTMVAHSLIEPEMRHSLEYLAESCLGYTPRPVPRPDKGQTPEAWMAALPPERRVEYAVEGADLALQLRAVLEPRLGQKGQDRVFQEIEAPLIPVLVSMEFEGIRVDAGALQEFAEQLAKEMDQQEKAIYQLAGTRFNLNSPRQLGQVLFEQLKLSGAPKKTRTGQYATDEQTLVALAADHEIARRLLEYRAAAKLKSTYADALPAAICPRTGRIHTTFNQVMTATGRLSSQDPNLQNIPIRTERGQEIRKAFVPRDEHHRLMSADYSQIELRIIAALTREPGLLEAFRTGADVHTATAARVFGVFPDMVTPEMRRKAKMVNYGIAYGISAFGLAQRLGIPRKEATDIIEQYFAHFAGIRKYMDDTIAFARRHGYVETLLGRRRYIRDINSSNNTVRSAAERNAINAPIQGTAADLIKLAMVLIHRDLESGGLKTRMVLQVHDELVFDLYEPEETEVRALVRERMTHAIPLDVPLVVEIGVGENWLAAH
ncbi:MAG TPA: DNA polymerase I [Verrucomicrobiota bacterium]|nr:DNA polymerase I [Verrucomicrobiota bacterium]HRT07909.1 DNA polymerase I [Candidatus Paceibacterota bacterium]